MQTKHIINTTYYTAIPLLRSSLAVLTWPIMTRFLIPDDYGTISLISMITGFIAVFCLGLNNATYRFFFKYKHDPNLLKVFLSTNMIFIGISAAFYGLILLLLFPYLNAFFFKGKVNVIWVMLSFMQFTFIYMNAVNQNINQAQHLGKRWMFNEAIAMTTQVSLSIFLVVTQRFTFEAVIISGCTAESVKFLLLNYQLRRYYAPVFNKELLKESISYSWPMVPTTLISVGYVYFDRVMVSKFHGVSQVGILELGSQMALIMKMLIDGVGGVLSPVTLELIIENTEASLKKLADINMKIIFFLLCLGLCVILFTQEIIVLLTSKRFHSAIYVAPFYIYYHIFGILGMVSYWLIYHNPHKTYWQIPLNLVGLTASTIANIILIPRYGIIGAGVAVFLSSALMQLIQFMIGFRVTPIPMNMLHLGLLFIVMFAETGALYFLYFVNIGFILTILVKIAMVLFFVSVGIQFLNIISMAEILGYANDMYGVFKSKFSSIVPKGE